MGPMSCLHPQKGRNDNVEGQLEWLDEYNTGVDIIDREHQRLFRIINKLLRFKREEKDSQWTCQEGIKFFKGHAVKHL